MTQPDTYSVIASALINTHLNTEFLSDADLVKLTGRYASPVSVPSAVQQHNVISTIHVEVKSNDADAPKKYWVKFSDLKIILSVLT